jgi:hypothetical protein
LSPEGCALGASSRIIKNELKKMKKTYLIPEVEVLEFIPAVSLLAGSIPGEEGGENSGKEYKTDEGLDDILG